MIGALFRDAYPARGLPGADPVHSTPLFRLTRPDWLPDQASPLDVVAARRQPGSSANCFARSQSQVFQVKARWAETNLETER